MLCCKLTRKVKNSRWHWCSNCFIRSVWCWLTLCPGIPLLPPKISSTTPGSLMAGWSFHNRLKWVLFAETNPLFKIMPYFCLDHDLIMQGFVFCFFLLTGISRCLSFSFLLYVRLSYLHFFMLSLFFIPPALLSLSQFFDFAFCPLKTLSVPEAGCFLCMSAPSRSSGFPFVAFPGWCLLRKDTWKVNCLKMSVFYTHTEGRLLVQNSFPKESGRFWSFLPCWWEVWFRYLADFLLSLFTH